MNVKERQKNKPLGKIIDRYLIKGLSGMALGLFSTLIVGLIIKQIGQLFGDTVVGHYLIAFGNIATVATGVGIGVGVANALKASPLVIYASAVTGFIGAYASKIVSGALFVEGKITLVGPGDPLSAFIAVLVGVEIARLIAGKTKLDIVLTPLVTIVTGGTIAILIGPPITNAMLQIGSFIEWATLQQPFVMGVLVSVFMGIFLTLPISSAAISIILGLNGLAAGAATVGCACQMVGFAVASYRENKVNGLVAQGVGTSMLQMPNIVKNPRIWIPSILSSAILGPVATKVFMMTNNPAGGGMGTAGFVGQIMTYNTMVGAEGQPATMVLIKIAILHFILPALLTLLFSEMLRKYKWIRPGDMKLEV